MSSGGCKSGQLRINMSFNSQIAHISCDVKGTAVRKKSIRPSLTATSFNLQCI